MSSTGRRQTLGEGGRGRAASVAEVSVGQTVEVQGSQGVVRFAGTTQFAGGRWIGVELASASGKNDGTVNGVRYFSCAADHGLFVRQSQVKVVDAAGVAGAAGAAQVARRQTINPGRPVASRLSAPARRVSDAVGLGRASAAAAGVSRSTVASSPTPTQTPTASRSPLPPIAAAAAAASAAGGGSSNSNNNTGSNDDDSSAMAVDTPAAADQPETVDHADVGDASAQRQLEELRVKYRFLEQRRSEDRQRLLEADRLRGEAEQMLRVRDKLAARVSTQQDELRALRQQAKQAEAAREAAEARAAEALDAAELQTVDREVAEERAEALAAEAAALREQLAGRAGGAADGDDGDAAAQNERLKAALVRLRDVAAANEASAGGRIRQLERALAAATQAGEEAERQRERAAAAEATAEDLRMRLDDALGAEELVEQLGARNLDLGQRVEELQAAVESLEALCEVNDEMEDTRSEEEQRLREELAQAREQAAQARARCGRLEEAAAEAQDAVARYRELVAALQADVARLSAAAASGERAAAEASSQTHEMLRLGLQLRATATRSRAAAVDLALRRLDADQAAQQLRLTEPFVPDAFFALEAAPLRALLALRRLAAKAEIAGQQLDADAEGAAPDAAALEARAQLQRVSGAAHVADCALAACTPAAFAKAALALAADAQAAERRVDGVLALVRAEEFRPAAALQDVRRVAMHAESLAAEALAACGHVPRVAAVRAQVLVDHVARACDVALAASLGALAEQSLRAAKAASVRVARRLQGVGAVDASVVDGVAAAAEAAAKLCELALRGQGDAEDGDDAMDGADAEHVRQAADAATAALDAAIAALDAAGDSASAEPAEAPAPWERRAQAFKASLVSSADAERQLSAQREQVVSLARELKLRDQRVQDSAVRAAMLEKRVDELRRQARDAQDVQQALVQA
ncbi:hypothetical protein LPJ73_000039, partial [Coemansia sp. RSA 2703]